MQELEITGRRVLSIWWLLTWRGTAGILLIAAIAGVVIVVVGGTLGLREYATVAAHSVGALAGLVWGICVLHMALTKRYFDFRIAFLPVEDV